MKRFFLILFILGIISTNTCLAQTSNNNFSNMITEEDLIGKWYMGTMTGFDCNLNIFENNTLTIQFGGCFYQGPLVSSKWKLENNKMLFENPTLIDIFGLYLEIVHYKNNVILIPEKFPEDSKSFRSKNKYSYNNCFWRNIMEQGLQLPKEAYIIQNE